MISLFEFPLLNTGPLANRAREKKIQRIECRVQGQLVVDFTTKTSRGSQKVEVFPLPGILTDHFPMITCD